MNGLVIAIAMASAAVLPGCGDRYAPKIISPLDTQVEIIGRSVQGRPIECFRLGYGPEVIFIMAAIHGNEPAGVPLSYKLIEHLQKDRRLLQNRTILIIPVANPDGFAAGTRENINGVDLNRNFPAANRINISEYGKRALSEPESVALKEFLEVNRPAIIVSMHQPLNCIDYDGPGQTITENMSRVCNLPVNKLGARPGSLGAYVGEALGVPIITLEFQAIDSNLTADELWAKYGRALVAAIVYPEVLY